MFRFFIFFLLSYSLLMAASDDIDLLLSELKNSESSHLKTKKESSGFITSLSHSDLEKMQAFTLKDILKTLRGFNFGVNALSLNTFSDGGNSNKYTNSIKLFIDDNEISSATLGRYVTCLW